MYQNLLPLALYIGYTTYHRWNHCDDQLRALISDYHAQKAEEFQWDGLYIRGFMVSSHDPVIRDGSLFP